MWRCSRSTLSTMWERDAFGMIRRLQMITEASLFETWKTCERSKKSGRSCSRRQSRTCARQHRDTRFTETQQSCVSTKLGSTLPNQLPRLASVRPVPEVTTVLHPCHSERGMLARLGTGMSSRRIPTSSSQTSDAYSPDRILEQN